MANLYMATQIRRPQKESALYAIHIPLFRFFFVWIHLTVVSHVSVNRSLCKGAFTIPTLNSFSFANITFHNVYDFRKHFE